MGDAPRSRFLLFVRRGSRASIPACPQASEKPRKAPWIAAQSVVQSARKG